METPGDYFLTRRLTRHNLLRVFRQHGIYYKVILAEGAEHSAEVEPLWMLFSFYDQSVGGVQGTLGSLLDVDGNIWTEALSHCSDLILNDDRVYPGSCLLCQLWCVNPGFNTVVSKVGWGQGQEKKKKTLHGVQIHGLREGLHEHNWCNNGGE